MANLEQIKQFCITYGDYGLEPYNDSASKDDTGNPEVLHRRVVERVSWLKTAVNFHHETKYKLDKRLTRGEMEEMLRQLPIVRKNIASMLGLNLIEDNDLKRALVAGILAEKGQEDVMPSFAASSGGFPAGLELQKQIDDVKTSSGWHGLGMRERASVWKEFSQRMINSAELQLMVDDFADAVMEIARDMAWIENYLKEELRKAGEKEKEIK